MADVHPEGDITRATHLAPAVVGGFEWRVPDTWQQGRGAFGGLTIAAMTRAAMLCETDASREVRTVSAELLAPILPGLHHMTTAILRRGAGLSAIAVTVTRAAEPAAGELGSPTSAGSVLARATVTLAKARAQVPNSTYVLAPEMPRYETSTVSPVLPPLAPTFAQHFEFRATGPLPFSGGREPAAEGWIKAHQASEWGPPEWVAHVDAFWPTVLAIASSPRPVATIAFLVHLLGRPPRGPLFHRARMHAIHDGYLLETRELWTADGQLVAVNPQTIAVLG